MRVTNHILSDRRLPFSQPQVALQATVPALRVSSIRSFRRKLFGGAAAAASTGRCHKRLGDFLGIIIATLLE